MQTLRVVYERFNATKGYTRTDKIANANECASPERKTVQGVRYTGYESVYAKL